MILEILKISDKHLTKAEILVWIKPLEISESENQIEVIYKNSSFKERLLDPRFSSVFNELEITTQKKVVFVYKEKTTQESKKIKQIEKFIKTKENSLALKAFEALFLDDQDDLNPILIYGESGVGKTTLAKKFLEFSEKSKFVFAEDFVNDFFKEIKTGENKLKEILNHEVIVIDNIEFFEKRNGAQLKLTLLVDKFISNGGKVLFVSSKPKDELKLDPRLKSRITSGLVLQIKPPSKDTIENYLKSSGIENFPQKSFSGFRDLKSFCTTRSFLNSQESPSNEENEDLTPKEFLQNILKTNSISLEDLKKRSNVAVKNKIIFDLKNQGVSFVKIAELLGLSNHSSCIYAYNKFNSQNVLQK
jgi:chromosomal replication initiation ATPase DnaA